MSQRPPGEEQVKFRDVSVCFSEEEWKTLCQWQKDFYQNVMKEIHQALTLMGYQIVNPDNLLQIYKGKDAYMQVSHDAEKPDLLEPGLSSQPEVIPDVLFRISHKEESDCGERQSSEEAGGGNSSSSCFPVVTAAFSLTTEQELQLYPVHQQPSQRQESSHRLSRRKATSEVLSEDIKEENEDCEIIDVSGPTGDEGMNSEKEIGESLACSKTEASENALFKSPLQNSCECSTSHPWPERYLEKRGGQVTRFGRDKGHTEYIRGYQEVPKVQMSPEENENEGDPGNSNVLNSLPSPTKKQALHKPTEYNRSKSPQNKPPRVRAFPCLDCEKRFFDKVQLVHHLRTHTGERPYACSFCDKRYNRRHHLKGHIRTHTGEKPYTCPLCQQTYRYKSHLNVHQRTKH